MALTAEEKRARRLIQKKKKQEKNYQLAKAMVGTAPPENELKKPHKKEDLKDNNVDYGGHQKALNFTMPEGHNEFQLSMCGPADSMSDALGKLSMSEPPINARGGTCTIGLVHEGDWKRDSVLAGKGKRKRCKMSDGFLEFLLTTKGMLEPLVDPSLRLLMPESLRVNCIRGAMTLGHTDSHKGNAPNFLFIVGESCTKPGWLCHDTFPVFKCSVVKLFGKLCVPHSYSEASKEFKCIGANPQNPQQPIHCTFPASVLDSVEPCGNLDFGVIGWKANGHLQVVHECEGCCLCTAPLVFCELTWEQVIAVAELPQNVVKKKPRKHTVRMDKVNVWQEFKACCCRHWWCGNPMTLRHHAFFRTIRQPATSSNVNRKGKHKINYVDARTNNWKMHQRDSNCWCDIEG